jgi:hypothetical protein
VGLLDAASSHQGSGAVKRVLTRPGLVGRYRKPLARHARGQGGSWSLRPPHRTCPVIAAKRDAHPSAQGPTPRSGPPEATALRPVSSGGTMAGAGRVVSAGNHRTPLIRCSSSGARNSTYPHAAQPGGERAALEAVAAKITFAEPGRDRGALTIAATAQGVRTWRPMRGRLVRPGQLIEPQP